MWCRDVWKCQEPFQNTISWKNISANKFLINVIPDQKSSNNYIFWFRVCPLATPLNSKVPLFGKVFTVSNLNKGTFLRHFQQKSMVTHVFEHKGAHVPISHAQTMALPMSFHWIFLSINTCNFTKFYIHEV